jgi:hypothetical protein
MDSPDELKEVMGTKGAPEILRDYERFFKESFGKTVDLSNIIVPPKPPVRADGLEYDLLVIPKGTTIKSILSSNHSGCYIKIDPRLDETLEIKPDSDCLYRNSISWVVRSDNPIIKGTQAHMNRLGGDDNISGLETVWERLIHEALFYSQTGRHFDAILPTITSNYVLMKNGRMTSQYVIIVKLVQGASYVTFADKNLISGGRSVYNKNVFV